MLTRPLLLYRVPRCGPTSDRKVCRRPSRGFILGLASAARMMTLPSEWPTKLMRAGFRPTVST